MRPFQPTESCSPSAAPRRELTLYDSTCIIVGIILGAGVYRSSPDIAGGVPSVGWLVVLWLAGGLLSLLGALCYAELATAYPEEGGDYVYLRRAFGPRTAFLFAWSQLWIVRPGSIGAMAYIFAQYANELWPLASIAWQPTALIAYAAAPVVLLTLVNIVGVREGKWTQNVLTTIKIAGPVAIAAAGLLCPPSRQVSGPSMPPGGNFHGLYYAAIALLWTYGGWNEMAYVAAEVRHPEKNILRALVLGTVAVTGIYVLLNLVFVRAVGFQAMCSSRAVAADVLRATIGPWGGRLISILICISALGAINGLIFTGGRLCYALGRDYPSLRGLGRWDRRLGTPAWSLLLQGVIVLTIVVGLGWWTGGRKDGFQSMVEFTSPIFWAFFLLVGLSLFALRRREPATPRPFRVPWYPAVPAVFCLSSLFMLYASVRLAWEHAGYESVWAVVLMVAGIAASLLPSGSGHSDSP
ncbi:MAG: amino acid permease [Thermoguttaceae bacterium]